MLLVWGSLLCWGLLPQAQGKAHSPLFLRFSKNQLETDISDLFAEHRILDRIVRMPVTGAPSEGMAVLDHLPFVSKGLSRKSSGLDLSLVGDMLSGKSLPLLTELLQVGGLVIEDAKGPEVTLQILSDSLLQVTLRCKLYLSLQEMLRLEVLKNIRIGIRLEQTGSKTKVALEECHTPPGSLSIEVLEQTDSLLVNKLLKLVAGILDQSLPFLLQKIVCPLATTLLNSLLEDLLNAILLSPFHFLTVAPTISGSDDIEYYVTTTEFTEEAILMKVQLVTPYGPGQQAPRPDRLPPQPLPRLAPGSMADLVFWLEIYNDVLSCLYTSGEIHMALQDPTAADLIQLLSLEELEPRPTASFQSRGSMGLTISTPDPPTVHLDGHTAMVTQPGSLVLLGPNNISFDSVSWKLLSKAAFSSRNQKLTLQFTPNSAVVALGPYPAVLKQQEERLKAVLSQLLKRRFLPLHNEQLREHGLPLPKAKGISFAQARADLSELTCTRGPFQKKRRRLRRKPDLGAPAPQRPPHATSSSLGSMLSFPMFTNERPKAQRGRNLPRWQSGSRGVCGTRKPVLLAHAAHLPRTRVSRPPDLE